MQRRVAFAVCLIALTFAGCGDAAAPRPNPEISPARLSSPGWKVTRRYSVLQALIVEVECRDRERAVEIAKAIVEPVKDSYGEALIYVRPIDKTTTRRVQWRKADGEYRILDF
ncbi:MAG: hypothetical protein M3Q55_02370 [Acidobacteriota bacterium]|nr:hypothetical protein [Acidobacteriota bacterium]